MANKITTETVVDAYTTRIATNLDNAKKNVVGKSADKQKKIIEELTSVLATLSGASPARPLIERDLAAAKAKVKMFKADTLSSIVLREHHATIAGNARLQQAAAAFALAYQMEDEARRLLGLANEELAAVSSGYADISGLAFRRDRSDEKARHVELYATMKRGRSEDEEEADDTEDADEATEVDEEEAEDEAEA